MQSHVATLKTRDAFLLFPKPSRTVTVTVARAPCPGATQSTLGPPPVDLPVVRAPFICHVAIGSACSTGLLNRAAAVDAPFRRPPIRAQWQR
jgi:hypothetical protein